MVTSTRGQLKESNPTAVRNLREFCQMSHGRYSSTSNIYLSFMLCFVTNLTDSVLKQSTLDWYVVGSIPSQTNYCKNSSHCLFVWHSVFRVGVERSDQPLIHGHSTPAARCSLKSVQFICFWFILHPAAALQASTVQTLSTAKCCSYN